MILILIFAEALALYGLIGESHVCSVLQQAGCVYLCIGPNLWCVCSWNYSGFQGWQVSLVVDASLRYKLE